MIYLFQPTVHRALSNVLASDASEFLGGPSVQICRKLNVWKIQIAKANT